MKTAAKLLMLISLIATFAVAQISWALAWLIERSGPYCKRVWRCRAMAKRLGNEKLLLLTFLAWVAMSSAQTTPKYKVLHAFDPSKHDGGGLYGSLALDAKRNLYGMTDGGGGYGTTFELTPDRHGNWSETILHNFSLNDKDGHFPMAGLVLGADGNLYGMTTGAGPTGFGTVLKLKYGSERWGLSVLHDSGSHANLTLDREGNLYGPMRSNGEYDEGAISELVRDQDWKEKWL